MKVARLRPPGAAARTAEARALLQQRATLIHCQAGIAHDAAQGAGLDWSVAWCGQDALPIVHDRVFALANHSKSGLFQCANAIELVDAGNPRQESHRELDFSNLFAAQVLIDNEQVFADCVVDVVQRFLLGSAVRPASGQARSGDAVPFVGLESRDLVLHGCASAVRRSSQTLDRCDLTDATRIGRSAGEVRGSVDGPRPWRASGWGLLSCGTDHLMAQYRRAARFEMAINLKTAKALGLAIPQSLLLRADEVIQ